MLLSGFLCKLYTPFTRPPLLQGIMGLRIVAEVQIQDEELYQLKLKVLCVNVAVWQHGC
jgi:hypothetical protein